MSYTPPPADAVVFAVSSGGYTPPPADAVVFGVPLTTRRRLTVGLAWGVGTSRRAQFRPGWRARVTHASQAALGWGAGAVRREALGLRWSPRMPWSSTLTAPWSPRALHTTSAETPWKEAASRQSAPRLAWQGALAQAEPIACPGSEPTGYTPPPSDRVVFAVTAGGYTPPSADAVVFAVPLVTPSAPTPCNGPARVRHLAAALGWDNPQARYAQLPSRWAAGSTQCADPTLPWGSAGQSPASRRPGTAAPLGQRPILIRYPVESSTQTIPVLRRYLMLNTVAVTRLTDGAPIEAVTLQIGTDRDSWAWSGSMTLRRKQDLDALFAPDGSPLIEASVNGFTWLLEAERYREQRRFNQRTYRVELRSRSIELAAPRAALSSGVQLEARTAQQLAIEALDLTGWVIEWGLTDWLVPGGVHTWADAAPLDRVGQVATAAGAIVATYPSALSLSIQPRYSVAPWDWASAQPHVSLPLDVVEELGREVNPGPGYTGVFIAGKAQGVLCQVRRSGTQGERLAPQVIDPLITHADAGRQRGTALLGAAHIQGRVTLSLPLAKDHATLPALLELGQLLETVEGTATERGQVVGVQVSAESRPDGALIVRQNVEVEYA